MDTQRTRNARKALALRKAAKNARRTRRAIWEAYPVSDRLDYATGDLMLRLDLVVAEILGRIDGHEEVTRW